MIVGVIQKDDSDLGLYMLQYDSTVIPHKLKSVIAPGLKIGLWSSCDDVLRVCSPHILQPNTGHLENTFPWNILAEVVILGAVKFLSLKDLPETG